MRSLSVFLIFLCLWVPASGQDWTTFERLMELKTFQQASSSVEDWPTGPDRDLARVESLLALERPGLAWEIVTSTSVGRLPQHLRARFFLFRGRLQELQAEYKLAQKDFAQALREKPSSRIRGQVLGQQVALYLKLGDGPGVEKATDGFVDLPDQAELALQAASKRSLEEGRGSETLAILRVLQQQARNRNMNLRAAFFQLLEVEALWQTGRPHMAFQLARKLEESTEIRQDSSHWVACLLSLERMSREMPEHREQTLELLETRARELSHPLDRTRLLLTLRDDAAPRALEEARRSDEPRLLVLALIGAARTAQVDGEFETAHRQLAEAARLLEQHPQSYRGSGFLSLATVGEVLIAKARLAQRRGNTDKAVELLERAIQAEPGPYHAKWRAYAFRDMTQRTLIASDYHGARAAFFAGLKEIETAPPGQNKAYMLTVLFNAFFATHRVWDLEQLSLGMVGEFDPLGRLIMKELAQRPLELEWTLAAYRDWVAAVRQRGDRPKLSEALAFQGQYLISLGRFAEAESALLKAYEVATEENMTDMRQWSQMNLARSAYDQGQLEKAAAHMQKSVDILAKNDKFYSSYDVGLATVLAKLGRYEQALALYERYPESGACLISASALAGRRGHWDMALAKSDKAIELFSRKRLRGMLFQARVQKAKAMAHLGRESESEALFQQLLAQAEFGQALGLLQAWVKARQFLKASHSELDLLLDEAIETMDKRLPRELIALHKNADSPQFLANLHRMRSRDAELDQAMLLKESELPTIQSRLHPDQLFIYVLPVGDRIVVLLISRQSMRVAEIQVDKTHWEGLVNELVERLARPQSSSSSLAGLNKELSSLLLPALQPELSGAKELEVLAAGVFRRLPFEILVDDSGRALLERLDVSYVDAARPGLAQPAPLGGSKLLVGGSELQGATLELEKVGGLLGEHFRAESLDELKRGARSSSLIHVATHSEIQQEALGEGHFLLGTEKVTFQDIYSLKLPRGAVVVLSSCRSASGGQGRELVSLSSAFLFGGASAAIGSLWRVDDRYTAVFFEYFYQELSRGLTPGQALRAAKRKLKNNPDTAHPYYWAPFVLYGRAG
jgi:CHAT domain-containing protein